MADIAKLGIVVEASGIPQAQSQLQALAQTGQLAGKQLVLFGDNAGAAARELTDKAAPAAARLSSSMRPAAQAISTVTRELDLLGPAGNTAVNALEKLWLGAGPLSIALAVLSATIALLISRIQDARQNLRDMAERELRQLAQATENIKLDQNIRREIEALRSLDPELTRITRQYDDMTDAAKRRGAGENEIARIQELAGLKTKAIIDARSAAAAREQQAIVAQINAAQGQAVAVGRTGDALIVLNTQQRINAIAASEQAQKHAALTNELIRETAALGNLERAQNFFQSGKNAIAQFESNFGVQFSATGNAASRALAASFVATFNSLKDDPAARGALNNAFASLVSQLSIAGTPNISGLLTSLGLGPRDLATLRQSLADVLVEIQRLEPAFRVNAFGGTEKIGEQIKTTLVPAVNELKTKLDESDRTVFNWSEGFISEAERMAASAIEIGVRLDELNARVESVIAKVQTDFAMGLDVNQPLDAIAAVKARIDAIPDVTHKSVIFDVFYAASPAQPFSEFLPFIERNFRDLSGLISDMPDIIFNVPNFLERTRQIQNLGEQANNLLQQSYSARLNPFQQQDFFNASQRLSGQAAELSQSLRFDLLAAASQRSGSGGGGPTVTLDFSGATIVDLDQFLDEKLIPALHSALLTATGKDPGFVVLS